MSKESTTNNPVRIGYSLSLTGPLAENSKSARLAHQLWLEDINGRGGLLGRKVELICHDDQGDATQVANIYTQLLDKEKVIKNGGTIEELIQKAFQELEASG